MPIHTQNGGNFCELGRVNGLKALNILRNATITCPPFRPGDIARACSSLASAKSSSLVSLPQPLLRAVDDRYFRHPPRNETQRIEPTSLGEANQGHR